MNPQPVVSVILALYNVKRFLERKRLHDLRQQTYSNLEIILVDDGSTDGTGEMVEELSKEDPRISVIHKQNGGVGSARNAGLDLATGEFVYFCDIDDDLNLSLIEKSLLSIQENRADVLVFGFNVIYTVGGLPTETVKFNDALFNNNDELKRVFVKELLDIQPCGNGFVWNKFYRRDFIESNHFRFGNERIQQDELFNMRLYPSVNRLYTSSEVLYDYYIYESGNNRSRFIANRYEIYHSIYKQMMELCDRWGVLDNDCLEYINVKFYKGLVCVFLDNVNYENCPYGYKERKQEFLDVLSTKDVQDCLANMEGSSYFKGIKSKCYYKAAFLRKDYYTFLLLKWLFGIGDSIRAFLKGIVQ